MAYNFFVHTDLTFGKDAVQALPGILEAEGLKRIMVVYDGGVKAAGIAEKVLAEVKKADVPSGRNGLHSQRIICFFQCFQQRNCFCFLDHLIVMHWQICYTIIHPRLNCNSLIPFRRKGHPDT